jgi:transposase
MRDKELYAGILGVKAPWRVEDVVLDRVRQEVRVRLSFGGSAQGECPQCGERCPGYDTRRRSWRHLDTCQFKTIIEADVPRVSCKTHNVVQINVPWAEPGSGFTALMEALVIDWLKEACISAVADLVRLSWDQVDGIMRRAVKRGLERRAELEPTGICIDETSFQKRHEYVTVVTDFHNGQVLHVADDRKKSSLEGFWDQLEPPQLAALTVVCMDMCPAYILSVKEYVPFAEERICFDKFHVAKHLGDAVDKVRRGEVREQVAQGDRSLVGTRYDWLQDPSHFTRKARRTFEELKRCAVRTARAYAVKEQAMNLWHYTTRAGAELAWNRWIGWAVRTRLEPVKKVGRMVRNHLYGIVNAVVLRATNAKAESVNARIQRVKKMAYGFRSRERFRNAIYFHLGGLDLYPATHTTS